MPINAHPDYLAAQKEYLAAQTLEERIEKLKKMISLSPGHKGAENLRAQLRTRLKKFTSQLEKNKKTRRGSKEGIKKEGVQVILVGKTNSGKSSLMSFLTQAKPRIDSYNFTTKNPAVGMMAHEGVEFQIIENPAFESEYYDRGLVHTADILLLLITNLEDIQKLRKGLEREKGKQIVVYNKADTLDSEEKRKISANLQSKKYNFVLVSVKTKEGISDLKEILLQNSGKIRVYTKEPGKSSNKHSGKPVILPPESTIKDIAEKILHGFSDKIKETKIWGPSSKFPGQVVGLKHKVKDKDIVEFKTR
jgi:hypothetical protein